MTRERMMEKQVEEIEKRNPAKEDELEEGKKIVDEVR